MKQAYQSIAVGFVSTAIIAAAQAQNSSIVRCNTFNLGTTATDQHGTRFTVTGMSGICRRGGAADSYIAVMDNSDKLVFLTIAVDDSGSITSASMTGGFTLADVHDFEGIALGSGGASVFLSEEDTPAVHEYSLATGARLRTLTTPNAFASRRPNFGFESLAATDDLSTLWTANEEALTVDGPLSTITRGTTVRVQRLDAFQGTYLAAAQYAYVCDPIHGAVISGSRSGVSDLLFVPEVGSILVLERSFALAANGFFQSRVYEVSAAGATDTSAMSSLSAGGFVPLSKRALWVDSVTNMEGLTLGRLLPGGDRSIIGIVDDGDPISVNTLVGLRLTPGRCPADFNADGGVDGADVESFFTAWEAGEVSADVNADGGVDGGDVQTFFVAWERGGC
jgi:hypothetical protein